MTELYTVATPNQDLLFRTPNVYSWGDGFDVSPDGRTIVFMWNIGGQWELYTMPVAGGAAQQITSGADSKMLPRFSPDGTKIAFLQDHNGDENFDVYVFDVAANRATNLMPDTSEGLNEWLRWSPAGQELYYTSNREKNFAAFAVSARDGAIRRVSHHDYSDVLVEPSPNGKWLAVQAMIDAQNMGIFLVPTEGGPEIQLGAEQHLADAGQPWWSPDSRQVAFCSDKRGMSDIGLYDLATRSIEWITNPDCEYYSPVWSPRGDRIAYQRLLEGNVDLILHDVTGACAPEVVQIMPGIHNQHHFAPDGSALIFTYSGAAYPPDLWTVQLSDREARQLTDSLSGEFDRSAFVAPQHVWYPSLDPDVQVPALLYRPRNLPPGRLPPAILYVHGGPTSLHDNDWYPAVQDFVTRGYVVICPNYRGSTGYGKAFKVANRFDLGRGDTNDVAAAADYLIQQRLADPKRIAITGVSYGGFMTMTCTTQHPGKWAAGSALVPFVNWFTEHASEREDLQYWDDQNMGDPVKDYDRWYANSPIFFIDRITAPIQLIAGGNDVRCPKEEAEQVRDKLAELGRPVELHVYEDEGHSLRQLDNRVDAYRKRAAFIDRYLTGG
jgi:dipeptidyl aminopeptidase/acylaminoacyl peptidase